MSATDIQVNTALSLGQLAPNFRSAVLFGANPVVNAVLSDIWDNGGVYPFLSAQALEIVSSSAADAAAGTGARQVLVSGLDASGNEISVLATLNGVTPVAIGIMRVNQAVVVLSGSGEGNAGIITIQTVVGATAQCVIRALNGISNNFTYQVPTGYSLVVGTYFFSTSVASGGAGAGNVVKLFFQAMFPGTNTWVKAAEFLANDFVASTELRPYPNSTAFPAGTKIKFSALCTTQTMLCVVGMIVTLVKNGVDWTPCQTGECGKFSPFRTAA